jgi:hypothetical protein
MGSNSSDDDVSLPEMTVNLWDIEDDDLEEGELNTQSAMIKTRNEVNADFGPVNLEDISIAEDALIERLGSIEQLMGTMAIIKAHVDGEYRVLDEGGIVVTENRFPIGTVYPHFASY